LQWCFAELAQSLLTNKPMEQLPKCYEKHTDKIIKKEMNKIKSIWTTITGSLSSIIPLFFTVCKSGACGAVCVSPIASLLGISSASLIASPLMQSLFPLLLVISAVSFTVSYYKIYVLPKYASNSCQTDCACEPIKNSRQHTISLWTFWVGLIATIFFFTYFEYQNYKAKSQPSMSEKTECCSPSTTTDSLINQIQADTTKPCCSEGEKCE
jgi:hypothetical protein